MKKKSEFNFFTILEKDNKELTHSAFFKYALEEYPNFRKTMLGDKFEKDISVNLEKSYRFIDSNGKKKIIRFDIEIKSGDEHCIVENKFKCIPTRNQLETYTEYLRQNREIETKKILISFAENNLKKLPNDWEKKSYRCVLKELKKIKEADIDKKMFVDHYISFLESYIVKYDMLRTSELTNLFKGFNRGDNRFYLRLILSELVLNLHKHDDFFKKFHLDLGSTNAPLINLHPLGNWKNDDHEYLIQFQNDGLKLYFHYHQDHKANDSVSNKIIELKKEGFIERKGERKFKVITAKRSKSMYVYKESILSNLCGNVTVETLEEYIVDFYKRIDLAIFK